MKMIHIDGPNRLRCGMPLFNEDFIFSLAIGVQMKLVITKSRNDASYYQLYLLLTNYISKVY